MTTPLPFFNPRVQWANGGCLQCGANFNDAGKKIGVQGVSLDVDDDHLGTFALCYSHAVQVGLAAGMSKTDLSQEALEALEQAEALREQAAADAAQARLDRDVVERLVGSVYTEAGA